MGDALREGGASPDRAARNSARRRCRAAPGAPDTAVLRGRDRGPECDRGRHRRPRRTGGAVAPPAARRRRTGRLMLRGPAALTAPVDPALAATLLDGWGFLVHPDLPDMAGDAYLLVALRPAPQLDHFDPERLTVWVTHG